ncbi:hypothetical protein PV08_04464 [Exophiala spinifera]|uniref:Prokaryotic-type class I peptide chain release factors domain-containing protein n=1 Tax=Exophiala spinifera TaxID=91928 RepID=A0A0D2BE60_9EURO|nr:uncharacterized protein PV08_04464 [Exophiala spinifera]KIW17273.1 hypothetical protein PV08_04464 [Exophiala spinifera]
MLHNLQPSRHIHLTRSWLGVKRTTTTSTRPRTSNILACAPHASASGSLVRRLLFSTSPSPRKKHAPPLPPRPSLPDHELKHTFVKGTGPGGQKINKTNSAAQVTHLPTGIVVKCQATRSRNENFKIAKRILAEKVEFLEKGDESRVAKVVDRAKRKKASRVKKSRRKYRKLSEGEDGENDEGHEDRQHDGEQEEEQEGKREGSIRGGDSQTTEGEKIAEGFPTVEDQVLTRSWREEEEITRRKEMGETPQRREEVTTSSGLSDVHGDFEIEVKLRSKSKAARNDPSFTLAERELYEKVLSEQSKGGLVTAVHRFAAYHAVRGREQSPNELGSDSQEKRTSDDGDAGNVSESIEETRKDNDAEESQGENVMASLHGEHTEGDSEHEGDDDKNDLDDESDLDDEDPWEYTSEDEDRSEYDPDYEFDWLEPINVEVTHTTKTDEHGEPMMVAFCSAKLIRRGQMRDDFYGQMEPPSRETSMLAFDLFDRYGRLRSEYKTHPVMKGTGVWGQELSHGDILLIEEILVNKDYRRQGLGRRMIESLFRRVRDKTWSFFAFVWPTVLRLSDIRDEWDSLLDDAERQNMAEREHDRATMFCRSLGFRRVGSTIWFAWAPKTDHLSHQLAAIDDFNPPEAPSTSLHPLLTPLQRIADPPPPGLYQLVNQVVDQEHESTNFLDVLKNCMQQNGSADACWMSRDKHGNTVLHLTASIFDVACVEWIVKQDFGARLREMRNYRGETPLELVQFKVETLRTQKVVSSLTIPVSDRFEGHDENAVRCLILLQGLVSVESLVELQGQDALLRIIGGCTCGQCLRGFLSPRMSRALIYQGEIGYDMMNDFDEFAGLDLEFRESRLDYLPSRVRNNLRTNKSMRQGFVNLWMHIATCLEKGDVPTTSNVLDVIKSAGEWPPATRNFLQRGGTVESVFLAICRAAMEQDEWMGDGCYQEVMGDEIAKLPECRNDHEFGYVSGMCGYRRICLRPMVDMMGNRLDEDGNMVDSRL